MQSLSFCLLMPTHSMHGKMMKNHLVFILLGLAFIKVSEADLQPPKFIPTKPITNIFVKFGNGNGDIIKQFQNLKFSSREEKSVAFVERLKLEAQLSQQNALQLLRSPEFGYSAVAIKEFWITNEIYVQGASRELIKKLETLPEVGSITEEVILQYEDFQISSDVEDLPDWNLRRMEIEEAWNLTQPQNRGRSVVVATVDAGVLGDHDTIASKSRVNKYWFDAIRREPYPVDRNYVGTFLMGLLVGDVVGVAPDAQWIACAACDSNQCTEVNLKTCGEFILAPTDPNGEGADPTLAPNVVTGSWGASSEVSFVKEIIDVWNVVDILPVFPAGGRGPLCQTMFIPGSYENVLGVGVTSRFDSIMETSSRGPSYYDFVERMKPDLTAPGELIRSAWGETRFAHATLSGNIFGAVQVAGVAALLIAHSFNLRHEYIKMYLIQNTDTDLADPGPRCNGGDNFPNFHYGYGIVNARKAVQALIDDISASASSKNKARTKKHY